MFWVVPCGCCEQIPCWTVEVRVGMERFLHSCYWFLFPSLWVIDSRWWRGKEWLGVVLIIAVAAPPGGFHFYTLFCSFVTQAPTLVGGAEQCRMAHANAKTISRQLQKTDVITGGRATLITDTEYDDVDPSFCWRLFPMNPRCSLPLAMIYALAAFWLILCQKVILLEKKIQILE